MSEKGEKWLCWTHWVCGRGDLEMVQHRGAGPADPECQITTHWVTTAALYEPPLGGMTATEAMAEAERTRKMYEPTLATYASGTASSAGDLRDWIPSATTTGKSADVGSRLAMIFRFGDSSYVAAEDYDALRAERDRIAAERDEAVERVERLRRIANTAIAKSDAAKAEIEHGEQVRDAMRTEIEELTADRSRLVAEHDALCVELAEEQSLRIREIRDGQEAARAYAELQGLVVQVQAQRDELYRENVRLRAEGSLLNGHIVMHSCKPPLGNPTREEAITALNRILGMARSLVGGTYSQTEFVIGVVAVATKVLP
jgi:hypothetical protein